MAAAIREGICRIVARCSTVALCAAIIIDLFSHSPSLLLPLSCKLLCSGLFKDIHTQFKSINECFHILIELFLPLHSEKGQTVTCLYISDDFKYVYGITGQFEKLIKYYRILKTV